MRRASASLRSCTVRNLQHVLLSRARMDGQPTKKARVSSQSAAVVEIDGSILEGGGQILRNAAALSAITGTPIAVRSIRAGRSKPGLRPQHLAGLQLVQQLTAGSLSGGEVGSSSITLQPGSLRAGSYSSRVGTAGSCTLLAQTALPCLLFSNRGGEGTSSVQLEGGTDVPMAPPVAYMQHVLLTMLQKLFGVEAELTLERRGFYPKGGGRMTLRVASLPAGAKLPAFDLTTPGELQSISISAFRSGKVPGDVAKRMAGATEAALRQALGAEVPISVELTDVPPAAAFGDGTGMVAAAQTSTACMLGVAAVGERGKQAQQIGADAAQSLIKDIRAGGCVDQWLQDQLIIFMALAEGTSRLACGPLTLHTQTAIAIAEQLTAAKFTVKPGDEAAGEPCVIECHGAGLAA